METVKLSKACGKISITVSLTLNQDLGFVLLVNTNSKSAQNTVITRQQVARPLS